jgi:hypothetical protein
MIVCDVCKRKVFATEVEIQFKGVLLNQTFPFPIKMHLCNGHATQLVEAVKLVASIFRSIDEMPNEARMKEWIERMVPWTFNDKGQRTLAP